MACVSIFCAFAGETAGATMAMESVLFENMGAPFEVNIYVGLHRMIEHKKSWCALFKHAQLFLFFKRVAINAHVPTG